MLKNSVLALSLAIALASPLASACQVSSAKITGTISGNDIEGKTCFVMVTVESVKPDKHCPLNLKVDQEIKVRTNYTARNCPEDESPVDGEVSNGGGDVYNFTGKI